MYALQRVAHLLIGNSFQPKKTLKFHNNITFSYDNIH